MSTELECLHQIILADDQSQARQWLAAHPELHAHINDPVAPFDSPLIIWVRSNAMLDLLCAAGADLNARSRWWAGGFGLLDQASPAVAGYAIERGATVDVHAAARLGRLEALRELVAADPARVRARGGDGQTPLHFARTIAVAEFLLAQGAELDARDVDHESTAAQYMVRDRPEVCRYLVQRGCQTDLFLAAALGEAALVQRHLASDPASVGARVNEDYFPKHNPRSGGTIYQWVLGRHVLAHDVARQFGQAGIYRLLMEHSPVAVQLAAACSAGDEVTVQTLIDGHSGALAVFANTQARDLVYAAYNNQTATVRLLLRLGLAVATGGPDGATALHWAAFHGNAVMTRELLARHAPLEVIESEHHATPLGWATYGSEHGWHRRTGDFPATVELLLAAGARTPDRTFGTAEVRRLVQGGTAPS